MLQELDYPNTGAGFRIDEVKFAQDGVHAAARSENWIAEESTPRLEAARKQMMDEKPWPENSFPGSVKIDGPQRNLAQSKKKKPIPNIAALEKSVALCR